MKTDQLINIVMANDFRKHFALFGRLGPKSKSLVIKLYSWWTFSGLLTDGWWIKKTLPLPKICHTYLTVMKLGAGIPYLKKIQKIHKSRDTSLEFCWHQHFFTENQQLLLYQEIQILGKHNIEGSILIIT